jgi:hypothetical protein
LERRQPEIVATGVIHGLHAGHRFGRGHIDRDHVGVRLRGANKGHMQATLWGHVVQVLSRARQQRGVLQALNGIS